MIGRTCHCAAWAPRAAWVVLIAIGSPARAQVNELPAELRGVGIDERPGARLPLDARFVDQEGHAVRLGDYFDGQGPVVLALAYYRCPMLCTLVLNGLGDALRDLALGAGDRFRLLTVSIDPSDTPAMARAKRANQLAASGRTVGPRGWDFLVGAEPEVRRLANAVGFHYRYDAAQKQYAHAAGVFVVTPGGLLSRTLYGIRYPEKDLRLALVEASQGRLGGAWEKVLLLCYHYDPQARGYVVGARRVMRLGGALTVVLLLGFFARLARGRRALVSPGAAAASEETGSGSSSGTSTSSTSGSRSVTEGGRGNSPQGHLQ